jgi:hypothetical protein
MSATLADVVNDDKKTIMPNVRKYYGQLVGATVTHAILVKPNEDDWTQDDFTPLLVLKKGGDTFYVELWSDPEGNGAGHAHIELSGDSNG